MLPLPALVLELIPGHRAPLYFNALPLKAGYAISMWYQIVVYISGEYKTFIIVAESLKKLPQVDLDLSYVDKYLVLKRCCHKWVIKRIKKMDDK